jgi:hypothetical protein
LSCVLRGGVHLEIGGGYHQAEVPHALMLAGGEPVPLGGASQLRLTVLQQYRIVEDSGPRGPWKVQTVAYTYAFDDVDANELVGFHWHPRGPSPVTWPHLHVGPAAQVGAYIAPSTHIPTGRVSLEEVIRLAITELGVDTERDDWADVLDETQTAYETWRTWPSPRSIS